MSAVLTLAKREWSSLFFSPVAYAVIGLFGMGCGLVFLASFVPGQEASLRGVFNAIVWLLVFLVPAIGMKFISEEVSGGTLERLMTLPVSEGQVVLGKWLAGMAFITVLLGTLLLPIAVLEVVAEPDYGPIFAGVLGLLLVGGLFVAVALFASATTSSQVVAYMAGVFVNCGLTFVLFFVPQTQWAKALDPAIQATLQYGNVNRQFADFGKGLIDLRHFVYFLTGTALFLFGAVKLLESRRWR
ncbi:MAG: ABC transporter permease [Planctomycetota bacterium]